MPLVVNQPRPKPRLRVSLIGLSRQKAIVAEVERSVRHLSNSNAKHLHVGLFKRPKARDCPGAIAFRQLVERYHTAFSEVTMRIERIVAEADWVATHWIARGTHAHELMGIAPTGKEVTVEGMQIDRIRDGKIVESHGLFDALGMLQQLGAVPAAEPAHA